MYSQNEKTVKCYLQQRRANEITEATLAVDLQILKKLVDFLGDDKTFKEATKDDIIDFVRSLVPDKKDAYRPGTLHIYKRKLKLFYRWLYAMDRGEYPTCVKWISGSNPKSTKSGGNLTSLTPETVLTEEEVIQLIQACEDHKHRERDQALVMLTYEAAARANETLSLRIGSIQLKKDSGVVVLHGKEGARRLPFVLSYPYIARWLNIHPWRQDSNAPLWLNTDRRYRDEPLRKEPIKYDKFYEFLLELKKRAHINKPCNPHSLRHARLTVLSKSLPEAKVKIFAGWKPDSRMVSTYVHLSGRDLDFDILSMYGKADTEKPETTPMLPKTCQRCEMENPATAEYCLRCGFILDAEKAVELMSEDKTVNEQTIKELQHKMAKLEKKNEELKQRLNEYSLSNEQVQELLRRIEKLEKQAQKQK